MEGDRREPTTRVEAGHSACDHAAWMHPLRPRGREQLLKHAAAVTQEKHLHRWRLGPWYTNSPPARRVDRIPLLSSSKLPRESVRRNRSTEPSCKRPSALTEHGGYGQRVLGREAGGDVEKEQKMRCTCSEILEPGELPTEKPTSPLLLGLDGGASEARTEACLPRLGKHVRISPAWRERMPDRKSLEVQRARSKIARCCPEYFRSANNLRALNHSVNH